jgi:hypothetical protein
MLPVKRFIHFPRGRRGQSGRVGPIKGYPTRIVDPWISLQPGATDPEGRKRPTWNADKPRAEMVERAIESRV